MSIYVRDSAAILETLEFFEPLLRGNKVILCSDSKASIDCLNSSGLKLRDFNKKNAIIAKITLSFPKVAFFHLAGNLNMSDFLSRLVPGKENGYFCKPPESHAIEGTTSKIYDSLAEYMEHDLSLHTIMDKQRVSKKEEINMLSTQSLDEIYSNYLKLSDFH